MLKSLFDKNSTYQGRIQDLWLGGGGGGGWTIRITVVQKKFYFRFL
jgi:hypothetical protein